MDRIIAGIRAHFAGPAAGTPPVGPGANKPADRVYDNVVWLSGDFMGEMVGCSSFSSPLEPNEVKALANAKQDESAGLFSKLSSSMGGYFSSPQARSQASGRSESPTSLDSWHFMQASIICADDADAATQSKKPN